MNCRCEPASMHILRCLAKAKTTSSCVSVCTARFVSRWPTIAAVESFSPVTPRIWCRSLAFAA